MNDAHGRFHDWLTSGAEGDPPRDLAVHASVCDDCGHSIAAFDRLAGINPGLASMPAEPTGSDRGRLAIAGWLPVATAALFGAAILGIGVSQLIGMERHDSPVAQASPTPDQNVLGQTATPQPSLGASPSVGQETLNPLGTAIPTTQPHPGATLIPRRTPAPTPGSTLSPTAVPTPTPVPTPTLVPTATPTPTPTPIPTPAPTAPSSPESVGAIDGVGSVELTWQPPASDGGDPVMSYNVYRSTTSGTETFLAAAFSTFFQDAGLDPGTYFYVVTAVNNFGESVWSAEVSATASP